MALAPTILTCWIAMLALFSGSQLPDQDFTFLEQHQPCDYHELLDKPLSLPDLQDQPDVLSWSGFLTLISKTTSQILFLTICLSQEQNMVLKNRHFVTTFYAIIANALNIGRYKYCLADYFWSLSQPESRTTCANWSSWRGYSAPVVGDNHWSSRIPEYEQEWSRWACS